MDEKKDATPTGPTDEQALEPEVVAEPEEVPPEPPEPPRSFGVLMDILARAREEAEAENRRLLEEQRAREEEERRRREEEERRRAEEARRRVEEERRKREAALREFEQRKAQKEAEAKAPSEGARPEGVSPPSKRKRPAFFVGVGVVAALVLGAVIYAVLPKPEPINFPKDRLIERARPGQFQTSPFPFGPKAEGTLRRAMPLEQLIAAKGPATYEPPPPQPKAPVAKKGKGKGEEEILPKIQIQKGILGGKKVVK